MYKSYINGLAKVNRGERDRAHCKKVRKGNGWRALIRNVPEGEGALQARQKRVTGGEP